MAEYPLAGLPHLGPIGAEDRAARSLRPGLRARYRAAGKLVYAPLLRRDQDYSVDRQRWRARRAEAREELRRGRADLDLIELSIQRLADVRDMRPLLLVLGAFALVGVVQPLAIVALRPVAGSALARGWVVVSFTAALAVLLVFL